MEADFLQLSSEWNSDSERETGADRKVGADRGRLFPVLALSIHKNGLQELFWDVSSVVNMAVCEPWVVCGARGIVE
jgi:hypothetical protein